MAYPRTESEAYAVAKAIRRRWNESMGAQPFGLDRPTMKLIHPQTYAMFARCERILLEARGMTCH